MKYILEEAFLLCPRGDSEYLLRYVHHSLVTPGLSNK